MGKITGASKLIKKMAQKKKFQLDSILLHSLMGTQLGFQEEARALTVDMESVNARSPDI